MLRKVRDYNSTIETFFYDDIGDKNIRQVTFQVTDACNLRCTYCYQTNKQMHRMSFETAKKLVDYMFEEYNNPNNEIFYKDKAFGLVIEFIGGEPLLEAELIYQIMDYCETKFLEHQDYTWFLFHQYSICSNGVLYFTPAVQKILNDFRGVLSLSVTVDGVKEYHDACRIFPNGTGSYDLAIAAALDWKEKTGQASTKITISPDNVKYMYNAIVNMYTLGFDYIHINCVFEDVWSDQDAKILYEESKKVADWIIDNDIYDKIYIRIFDSTSSYSSINPYECAKDNKNFCGTSYNMMAMDYKGDFFTCIRFMGSSLNGEQPEYIIGNIDHGFGYTAEEKQRLEDLHRITLLDQSEEKCIQCKYASSCGWCSGYNYQKFGTIFKRATFICHTNIAFGLATYYLDKKLKNNSQIQLPDDNMALLVISQEELAYLKTL